IPGVHRLEPLPCLAPLPADHQRVALPQLLLDALERSEHRLPVLGDRKINARLIVEWATKHVVSTFHLIMRIPLSYTPRSLTSIGHRHTLMKSDTSTASPRIGSTM